nr:f-box/lrr-repeat protein 4 [Quercus suber]
MRGHDRINRCLPDELLIEIFRRLHDSKPSRDACSLVCKRWLNLECLSRSTLHIGASGCPDHFLGRITRRFVNVKTVHIDERLSLPIQFEHPSKRFVHKARPSHGEVVQANGVDTRPYLLRAEEQGRGIVKKARPSVRMDEPSS